MPKIWYKNYGWKSNPFNVRADSKIFGLDKERELLMNYVLGGNVCFITGPTGAGKTSLLKWLQSNIKGHKIIYLDSSATNDFFNLGKHLKDHRNFFELIFHDFPRKVVLLVDEAHCSEKHLKDAIKLYWDNAHVKSVVVAQIPSPNNFSKVFRARAGGRIIRLSNISTEVANGIVDLRTKNKNIFERDAIESMLYISDRNPRKFLENCEKAAMKLAGKWNGAKFSKADVEIIFSHHKA